ncbi:MAG: LLM class F420-dependent oxidoreductase [Dehalococcoidia bacterium]|uniref:LLM class F420-dependent oxidoreductase n=1 Tax=Candidatus Amarobacter glycogenicus TaxID=3140699 RepID=UPI003136A095|nr:LLM class F420-dependent oxidoreductase [Dehalococcoidia bacterium]MBK7329939.1 LLM class F420-dependent oxidoreductase [Dehalococcoidia bacterium]MCC6267049.1 LLM class F420-dependent oxidoreductase [Dehalococcoidia bacterium]
MQKRIALSVPILGYTLPEHVAFAKEAEQLGYTDAWSFEVDGQDCFTPLAVMALSTNMRLGTAIANVYSRGPATLAQSAASIGELAPGRFEFGIGSGSQPIIEMWNNGRFIKPATRVKEMVQFLRPALAGERVVFKGETFQVDGFRLSQPPPSVPRIHVAALREGMLTVAGEVGDGAIINWLSAEDVKKSVAVVREAAAKAGRDPAEIEITARLMVNIDPPGPEAELMRKRHINAYLQVPVYKSFHQWLGRSETLRGMWESWDAGDRRGAIANTPEQVVDDLIVHGTAEQRNEHVQRYLDAGVDTAFLSWFTCETDPLKRRELIHKAMVEMAPRK